MRRLVFRQSAVRSAALVALWAVASALAPWSPASPGGDPVTNVNTNAGERVHLGSWGGEHVRLEVSATGATLEFDCAFGRIDEPLLADSDGNFQARGVVMFEAGGPVQPGQARPPPQDAIYDGWTDGRELRLTVTILADAEWQLGTFTLGLGRMANLEKCL